MTDKTQILTVRIPKETRAALSDIDMRKFLEDVARKRSTGAIEIRDNCIVVPEAVDCDECPSRKVHEEVKDIAHDKGMTVENFFRLAKR